MAYSVTGKVMFSQLFFNFWIVFLNKSRHKTAQVRELDLAELVFAVSDSSPFKSHSKYSHSFSKYPQKSVFRWTVSYNRNLETDSYFWNNLHKPPLLLRSSVVPLIFKTIDMMQILFSKISKSTRCLDIIHVLMKSYQIHEVWKLSTYIRHS